MIELDQQPLETFDFKVGKKTYSIPAIRAMSFVDYRAIIDVIDGTDGGMQRIKVIETVIDVIEKHAPGSTKGLSVAQADKLVSAYMKGGAGGGVGE